jgi:hypothetical protein
MEPRAGRRALNRRKTELDQSALLLRKSESLIVRTTVVGVIAKAEHTIRPAPDCSAA